MDAPTVWIDAAGEVPEVRLFGMTPVERHVRAALQAGFAGPDILVDVGGRATRDLAALGVPAELAARGVALLRGPGDAADRLARALAGRAGPVFAVAADTVVDPRLFRQLRELQGTLAAIDDAVTPRALPSLWSRLFGDWPDRGDPALAALLVQPGAALPPAADVHALARALVASGAANRLRAGDFRAHVAMQRRDVPFWLRRVRDAAEARAVERFMFDASYKGSTDVFTRYVYPYLVWPATGPLTRRRVHPNTVTWVSVAATFAAVPCFAAGWWVAGLLLAYSMSVLDSVDGKVARVTFTESKLGEVLDHGLDIVHPPLWYFAWAVGLAGVPWTAAGLERLAGEPLFAAALWMTGLYVADRLVLAVYKARHKRGLHAHRPLDRVVRSFISRRNINLPLFTVGLALGLGEPTFWLIVVWQAATVLWHAGRTVWILARNERPAGGE